MNEFKYDAKLTGWLALDFVRTLEDLHERTKDSKRTLQCLNRDTENTNENTAKVRDWADVMNS